MSRWITIDGHSRSPFLTSISDTRPSILDNINYWARTIMVYSIGWYPGNGFRTHGIIGIVLIIFLEINVYVP